MSCKHDTGTHRYDCFECDDCGWIMTDSDDEWSKPNTWFSSYKEAKGAS